MPLQVRRDDDVRERRGGHRVLLQRQVDQAADHGADVRGLGRRLGARGSPTLTAMTMSAPMARTVCTGRFWDSPPSIRRWPSISTGVKIAGIAMLARIDPRQAALRHHVGLAGLDVRGHRAERNAQLVEVGDRAGQHRGVQDVSELAAGDEPGRQDDAALLEVQPELDRDQVLEVVLFLPEGLLAPSRARPERASPT